MVCSARASGYTAPLASAGPEAHVSRSVSSRSSCRQHGTASLVVLSCPSGLDLDSAGEHRKIKTQILGQPNPETKGKKKCFRAHFETHSKSHFVAS